MMRCRPFLLLLMACLFFVAGCDMFSNPATRLANSIEVGAEALGQKDGSAYVLMYLTPASGGECLGPYSMQLDTSGKITIWCKDAAGHVTSSAYITVNPRLIDISKTYHVDKSAGTTLTINLERVHGRAVLVSVQ